MKTIYLTFGILLASCTFAYADSVDLTPPDVVDPPIVHTKRHNKRNSNVQNNAKDAGSISGKCIVVTSVKNPFAGACVDMQLILNDENGKELYRTRADKNGAFRFADTDSQHTYQIVTSSEHYEVISPTKPLHNGDHIDMRVQQK